jgi:hypothetical protein
LSCPSEIAACSDSVLWLTGDIERGDADKVADELKRRGPIVATVILAKSAGGSAREAMKIGRLLRRLHIVTGAGWAIAADPKESKRSFSATVYYPQAAVRSQDNKWNIPALEAGKSVCVSAWFDIWLGGYRRFGYFYLAIHAPYIEVPAGLNITIDRIAAFYRQGMLEIQTYHLEMGVPESLWNLEVGVPWDKFKPISLAYLDRELLSAAAAEPIAKPAECGQGLPDLFDVWTGKIDMQAVAECAAFFGETLKQERANAWAETF